MSRVGNFTSSQVYRLCTFGRSKDSIGAPFYTYVQEKLREHRTGRPIGKDTNAKSTNWGNFMEQWVFEEKMGLKYSLVSKKRYKHETLLFSGMPDIITSDTVGDIKNPYTVNSFCDLVDSMESIQLLKKNNPNYYWQLVANSILTGLPNALLLVHIPYKDELTKIREAADNYNGNQNQIAFLNWAEDSELPYIERGKYYQDINEFTFEVPQEDKDFLIERLTEATKLLTKQIEEDDIRRN
jgi:hypothetical protein